MKRLIRALVALAVIGCLCAVGALLWWRWATAPVNPNSRTPQRVAIGKGATARTVARQLIHAQLIRSSRVFVYLSHGAAIHPGVYDISPSESPERILQHLEHGDFATLRVTFPEGFTLRQIAHRLQRVGAINDEAAFLATVTTQGATFHASFPLPANLEGYLFPDTYRFPVGATDREIAQEMLTTFDKRVALPLSADIAASGRSLADIVNVASMVEREAEIDADRAPIAGVIDNRLARHMRLEMDATVQYAQGFHKTRLLYSDLAIDSPYNTYKVAGLPPTPICSPGLPSIRAAIAPARSEYLFYMARPDRSHVFAKTLAEHERNVAIQRKAFAAQKAAKAGTNLEHTGATGEVRPRPQAKP